MLFKNPASARENPFARLYDSADFKNVLSNRATPSAFPYLIDLELTNNCNLRCIFCGQQAMTREKGFMSMDIFRKLVDECAGHGTPIRFIRWGEPFLHPRIIEFAGYVKSRGLMLHITNNGLAIRKNPMEDLIGLQVDSIVFSFQGATKAQYEFMRDGGDYEKLKENILEMVRLRGGMDKPFIHISSTMTSESEEEINAFVNYWGNIADSVGIGKTNLSRLPAERIKSLEAARRLDLAKSQESIRKAYRPCSEVYQKLSVDWDGKVSACCGDYDNFLVIGDIGRDSLQEIWNSGELRLIRGMLDRNMAQALTLCSTCYRAYDEF